MASPKLSELSPDECLRLLAGVPVGRVGLSVRAMPAVFPVNFALLDGEVVFRTVEGTKFHAAVRAQCSPSKLTAMSLTVEAGGASLSKAYRESSPNRRSCIGLDSSPWSLGQSTEPPIGSSESLPRSSAAGDFSAPQSDSTCLLQARDSTYRTSQARSRLCSVGENPGLFRSPKIEGRAEGAVGEWGAEGLEADGYAPGRRRHREPAAPAIC